MSRSHKRNQILKAHGIARPRKTKRMANKSVRRYIKRHLDEVPTKGKWYRKVFQTLWIADVVYSTEQFWNPHLKRDWKWDNFIMKK